MILRLLLLALACAGLRLAAHAYSVTGSRWRSATVTMQLQLGAANAALLDGSPSWGAAAEDALNTWNAVLGSTKFAVVRDSTAARAEGNRINNVLFSGDIYGDAWGTGVLAVTLIYTSGASTSECDVLFNSRLNWNSYRGALRSGTNDFHRVAMHEFGHVLGLDHPDEKGQSVTALMNSRVSALDTLAADDIAGAQAIYGAPAAAAPIITTQPASRTVAAGESVTFTVGVSNAVAVTYQWFKATSALPGATGATLTLNAVTAGDAGSYSARVSSAGGTVQSATATLTVEAPIVKVSRLVNLSTRAFVPAGGALTPGFYIRGTAVKPLLIRAVGPTLTLFGVGTALAEARLDVIAQDTSALVASNNDWGGGPALRDAFASVGAFPLAADSKDAAVEASLAPRGYSVRVTTGDTTTSGITLAEIYDAEPATAGSAQLVNVSTLGFVGAGDRVLTAGFVISGNAAKRLLIRAVGPGLAPFGVSDLLPDPQLGVVPLGGSEPIATNDDWPDLAGMRDAFTAAAAFALPSGSKDAALVLTLDPGAYTVIVSGVSATATGNALVEIYDLDP